MTNGSDATAFRQSFFTYSFKDDESRLIIFLKWLLPVASPERKLLSEDIVHVQGHLIGKYMEAVRLWFRLSRSELHIEVIKPLSSRITQA